LIIYLVKDNELIPFSVHNSKPFFDKTKKLISEGQPVVIDHKQNALNTYWEYEFSENPKKYVSDITQDRFVDLKERSVNKLIDSKNFVYSQGSFDRIIKWRNIPLYKNCFDYSIYPTLLTEVKPKTIFELGTGLGASCIWYQDILKAHNLNCKIITFDKSEPIKKFKGIEYYKFNLENIENFKIKECPRPWLIIEDCHINLKGILNFFDKQMIQGDYLIVEDNDETKQEIIQNFMKNKTYQVDTRYTDFFGYNNCSFVNGVFKKS
tara:strand:- start:230 stop:1024 length:795 start_codon:yes stop_codon:yes gene_type:complete